MEKGEKRSLAVVRFIGMCIEEGDDIIDCCYMWWERNVPERLFSPCDRSLSLPAIVVVGIGFSLPPSHQSSISLAHDSRSLGGGEGAFWSNQISCMGKQLQGISALFDANLHLKDFSYQKVKCLLRRPHVISHQNTSFSLTSIPAPSFPQACKQMGKKLLFIE